MYKKRAGTSGIQGQLYETKLMSLIYFRLKHNDTVSQFNLATNRDDVGAFDDICFKAKLKNNKKPVNVFIQAKHREKDKLLTFNSKTELAKYFASYLDIRRAFDPSSKDVIFGENFDETECFFVMYTTAKDDPNNKTYEGNLADCLNEVIGTGGSCTQPSYNHDDLDFLRKIVMKEEIIKLAEQLTKFIRDESDSELSLKNDVMLRYHVILTLNVLHVSEIQPEGHRIASFRKDFFTTKEEFLVLIKNILCLGVVKKRKTEENDLQSLLQLFLREPSDVTILSKLIGNVLTYKNGKLEFINKLVTEDLKRQLERANVPESSIYEAAELPAKEYLLSLKFKVPALFGNKDLAIRGKPEKIEKRLAHLTSKIIEIIEQSKPNNIITIDEALREGFLQLNGGLASAVGNILVFDEATKLLKFTDNAESLGKLAKIWYEKLTSKIKNIHEYRLNVKLEKFPKLSFERGEYDMNLVSDFYDKLLFYTNQSDQSGVEKILKDEIEYQACKDANDFRLRSDLIFLKYHDGIQKLWMTPKVGSYLTETSQIYENSVSNAMNELLMSVLSTMNKIKNKDYTLNEDAVKGLELHGQIIGTVIATGSCVLTVAKLEQYLENKDHVVLDLEDVFKLPLKTHDTFFEELTNTTKEKLLILVCNNFQYTENSRKKLENIAKSIAGKQIIIVANKVSSVDIITEHFPQAKLIVDRTVFTDMNVESQKKLLANTKLKFQGVDLSLDTIVDDETSKIIDEDVLNQMVNNETLVIGKSVIYGDYNEIKPFYIDRRVSRTKEDEGEYHIKDHIFETLYDLDEDVLHVRNLPKYGKSTLLTHLSVKTKDIDPKVWIVRVNFVENKEIRILEKWQESRKVINTLESLKFVCYAALSEDSNDCCKDGEVTIELAESTDGTVTLKKCSGGNPTTVFQVKLFLHSYNQGKLIFIFDGFDRTLKFLTYEFETFPLLTALIGGTQQRKVWITSSFDSESENELRGMIGPPCSIEPFSLKDVEIYCYKFWKTKIQFKDLNSKQLNNVFDFVNFAIMELTSPSPHTDGDSLFFKYYYLQFLIFLKKEAVFFNFRQDEINNLIETLENELLLSCHPLECFQTEPYHLKILAESFSSKILDVGQRFFYGRKTLYELFE